MKMEQWKEICTRLGLQPVSTKVNGKTLMDGSLQEIIGLAAIPHCFFSHLLSHPLYFLHDDPCDESGRLLAYSLDKAGELLSQDIPMIYSDLFTLMPEIFECVTGIVVNPGYNETLDITGPEWEKVQMLAERHIIHKEVVKNSLKKDQDIELGTVDKMFLTSPDPKPPDDFLLFLRENFQTAPEVAEVYLFETKLAGEESSLVIGFVPKSGDFAIEPLIIQAMKGVEIHLKHRDCVDFLVLDVPEMLEIVRATVPPLY